MMKGNGDGTFQTPQMVDSGGTSPIGTTLADLNRDGNLDLISGSSNGFTFISTALGNGNGTFQAPRTFATGGSNAFRVLAGDFNADGRLDVATCNKSAANISVLLGNGDGTLQAAQTFSAGTNPHDIDLGDFNGDGCLDEVATNPSGTVADRAVLIFLNQPPTP
jgi:hypothetical protein